MACNQSLRKLVNDATVDPQLRRLVAEYCPLLEALFYEDSINDAVRNKDFERIWMMLNEIMYF